MKSSEFKHLLEFYDMQYGIQKDHAVEFIKNLELRKNIIDFKDS